MPLTTKPCPSSMGTNGLEHPTYGGIGQPRRRIRVGLVDAMRGLKGGITAVTLGTFSLLATSLVITPRPAKCDFMLTMASGVYQDASGQVKVVVGTKAGARGLFVMTGPAVSPQEFNLEVTPKEGFKHVFIRFDEEAQPPVYSHVIVNNHEYKVSGNLTITVGDLATVNIDNNNPYLSVVTEGKAAGTKPSIVAFSGLNEVVRGSGPAATILGANQLNAEVASVIKPYVIEDGALTLNGKPISTPTIGTFVKPDSECLNPNAIILSNEQVVSIQGSKTEEQRMKTLDQIMKDNKKRSPLKGHLMLKTDQKSVILLDIGEKNVKEMHPIKGSSTKRRLCVLSDLTVG